MFTFSTSHTNAAGDSAVAPLDEAARAELAAKAAAGRLTHHDIDAITRRAHRMRAQAFANLFRKAPSAPRQQASTQQASATSATFSGARPAHG